jgi:hypothetical protein
VATAAQNRLSIKRNLYTSFAVLLRRWAATLRYPHQLVLRKPRPAVICGPAIAMSDLVPADCFISPAYSL